MALQLFGKPEKYEPASLTVEGKASREQETNFLAFGDVQPSHAGKEYATAANPKNVDGSTNWAVQLDDTFAKPGVWKYRYQNIAPKTGGVYGTGYIDMGVSKKDRVELKTGSELMGGISEMLARNDGDETTGFGYQFTNDFAYENYGYKEQAKKEKMQAQAINGFKDGDTSVCPEGMSWNGMGCFPAFGGGGACAFGWEKNEDGRCELSKRQHIA